jgi:hypothetical protein
VPAWQDDLNHILGVPATSAQQAAALGGDLEESAAAAAGAGAGPDGTQRGKGRQKKAKDAPVKMTTAAMLNGILDFRKEAVGEGGAAGSARAAAGRGAGAGTGGPCRQQYHSVARLLDARLEQLARLRFLLEAHPDAAAAGRAARARSLAASVWAAPQMPEGALGCLSCLTCLHAWYTVSGLCILWSFDGGAGRGGGLGAV